MSIETSRSFEKLSQCLQLSESKLQLVSEELELMRAELAESTRIREVLTAKLAEYSQSADPVSLVKQAGADDVPATDLRSELAELFGLGKSAAENMTPPQPSSAFEDLSEPSGENPSVAINFGSDATQPAVTESTLEVVRDEEPTREETSDDFVRDYMEQLLSRNRKSGGATLSGELTAPDRKKEPNAAPAAAASGAPAPKSPTKVKSYIEQYMAGNMDDGEPTTMSKPNIEAKGVTAFDEERPVQPRPKMDLLKLKESMESFRTLSAQSVESALALHAIDVQRLSFTRRAVFAALLTLICFMFGIAEVSGAIDAPMLIWVTLISAIAVFFELFRQYRALAVHSPNPLSLLFTSVTTKEHIQRSTRLKASASGLTDSASARDVSVNEQSGVSFSMFGRPESLPAESQVS